MIGGKRDLASFERELESCDDWQDAYRVALDGLTNNVIARERYEFTIENNINRLIQFYTNLIAHDSHA